VVGREVALKVLHPDMARDPNLLARFRREGSVACNLRDAHTITTYDFDQTPEGVLYIAMELLKGRSLHDIFHESAPLAWLRVLRICEMMCSSLGEAHRQGIVHRDIKPENIYLEDRPGHPDYVKILDFGIAKIVSGEAGATPTGPQLTAIGQTLGTLEYMSPEQLMGKQLDGRSDIYAMGVVAYEMMTGRLPFPEAQGPAELIAAQLKKVPVPPSTANPTGGIPPEVDALILKMVEKSKEKRHADADAVAQAIAPILAAYHPNARAATPVPMPRAATPVPVMGGAGQPQAMPQPVGPPPAASPAPVQVVATTQPTGEQTQPVTHEAPSTQQALDASKGSRAWLWILIALVVVAGAAVGIYFGVIRRHH
jgi:serine/threonine-protein kinase